MEAITIPHIHIPSIDIGGICLPGIGVPDGGKKGLIWPKGLKESIKAIYDPALQGMTNYDVIEAYAEDFTNWTLDNSNGIATVTKNEIHITESIVYYRSVVRQDKVRGTQPFKVLISGLTDSQAVQYIYNDGKSYVTKKLTTNGVHELPASSTQRNGFNVEPAGACDVTIKQLPTSMLQDLSGNGNHAYLYGGKGKLNSGMGVYNNDFTDSGHGNFTWVYTTGDITVNGADSFTVHNNREKWVFRCTTNVKPMTVKIVGVSNDINFKYRYESENGEKWIFFKKDGIYELPATIGTWQGFNLEKNNDIDVNITVTQIPDYPDQLCYDGKMYAVCYGFPILTDYTVMADRTWLDKKGSFVVKGSSPNYGFVFERFDTDLERVQSLGAWNTVAINTDSGISYLTKNKYNSSDIKNGIGIDDDILCIGASYNKKTGIANLFSSVAHGKIIIADRSFTEDEITWLKDNFFTIDIPTPAYDFDFSKLKSGENTFADKYENELSLYNFAWNGMSGLGGYGIDVSEGLIQPNRFDYTYNNASKEFVFLKPLSDGTYLFNVKVNVVQSTQKIKFTNVNKPITFVRANTSNVYYTITKDGIYDIDFITDADTIIKENYVENEELNLKVQFLPNYPQALVFDGVDDYCKLPKMTIKTVILDFVNLELNRQIYDNRDKPNSHYDFSIYPESDTIAYEARNSDGKTYIDGELNTTIKTNDLLEVRCIVCASNNSAKETEQYISKDSLLNNFYGKMALYRITGFTEVLTPDQIWKWYQKNQPKGGDK